jgi:hypothetical protein
MRLTHLGLAQLLGLVLLPALLGSAPGAPAREAPARQPLEIKKLYFLFHPVCWALGLRGGQPPPSADATTYLACYEREKAVVGRQKEFFTRMRPDEALVLFPIGTEEPMKDLEAAAVAALGRRCIVVRRDPAPLPPAWAGVPNFFERFVSDQPLEGKEAFLRDVPPAVRAELEGEIRAARRGGDVGWDVRVLKVLYFSRLCALDLQQAFRERRLRIDPAAVESEAFGEGFEQCAMTWKAMLIPYLGFAKPAVNNFDLSVSGAPYLINARFQERVDLGNHLCLYLWEGTGGRCIGLYARSWCRLKDPPLYARVPVRGLPLEVWEMDKKRWPADGSPLQVKDGQLHVPVYNAIRRDHQDGSYVIAEKAPFAEFRRRLVRAAIDK